MLRPDNRHRLIEAIEVVLSGGRGSLPRRRHRSGDCAHIAPIFVARLWARLRALRPSVIFLQPSPWGVPRMQGFGNILRYDRDLVIPDRSKSLAGGAIEPWSKPGSDWWQQQLLLAMKKMDVDLTTPFRDLS